MSYQFKRYYNPIINTDVLNIFDEEGQHRVQATSCRDVPDSVLVAFSRDGGHKWYGHHKSDATTLDQFERRFHEEPAA